MTAIVTNKFRFANLRRAKRRIDEGTDQLYLGIGRSESWPDDNNPPGPELDFDDELKARESLQSIKKVTDITYCAPRYNWIAGSTYDAYDDTDPDLHAEAYYVLNPTNFNVYLCVKAGAGSSTVEPIGLDDGGTGLEADRGSVVPAQNTADGYVWKYMYTISAAQAAKYLTNDFMPVFRDANVAANAIPGAIHNIKVTTPGTGYTNATVTITGYEYDGTPITSDAGNHELAAATAIINGGQIERIEMTDIGKGYAYATVTITGNGTGAKARAIVATPAEGREIKSIEVVNGGSGYTNGSLNLTINGNGFNGAATATVVSNAISSVTVDNAGYNYNEAVAIPDETVATPAELRVKFTSPRGGFGYDPTIDMNAYYLMSNVLLEGDENPTEGFQGDFIVTNDYRQLMLISNPLDLSADQKTFTDTTGIVLNHHIVGAGGTWNPDDIVVGASSGVKCIVNYYDANTNKLFYHQTAALTGYGNFQDGEALNQSVGTSSGSISATTGSANRKGDVDKYSGQILYIENRSPVTRQLDQTEDIKQVVQF